MGLVFGQNLVIHYNMLKLKLIIQFKQRKHQTAALLNKPADDNISVNKMYNSKKQNFDAANCNVAKCTQVSFTMVVEHLCINVYKTLINNDHLSIVYVALKIEKIRIQVSEVTGFSLFEMVYHNEPPNFKFALQR